MSRLALVRTSAVAMSATLLVAVGGAWRAIAPGSGFRGRPTGHQTLDVR